MQISLAMNSDERSAMTEVLKAQIGTLDSVWQPLSKKEWSAARDAFEHYLQDSQLLDVLEKSTRGPVNVEMRAIELRVTLKRLIARRSARRIAEEARGEPSPERDLYQEVARLAVDACQRALQELGSRYEVRHLVVDTRTGTPEGSPSSDLNWALDLCEVANEAVAKATIATE